MQNARYEVYAAKHTQVPFSLKNLKLINSSFQDVNHNDSLWQGFGKTLILRIPSPVCNPCYDRIYLAVSKKIGTLGPGKFMIITDIGMLKNHQSYFAKLGLKNYLFGLKSPYFLNKGIDQSAYPYFVVYNRKQQIFHYLFVVNKDSTIRLNEYLKVISTILK